MCAHQGACFLQRITVGKSGETRLLLVIEVRQLRYSDVGEVLRTETEEAPESRVDVMERELIGKIEVLVSQTCEISFRESILPVAFRHGADIEKSRLPHEESLYLKQVITVVTDIVQRDVLSPCLKGIAVDAKAVVAGKGYEVSLFPRAVHPLGPCSDGIGLLLQTFGLQGTHP